MCEPSRKEVLALQIRDSIVSSSVNEMPPPLPLRGHINATLSSRTLRIWALNI